MGSINNLPGSQLRAECSSRIRLAAGDNIVVGQDSDSESDNLPEEESKEANDVENELRLSRSPFESYPPKPPEIKSRRWKKKRLEKSNAIYEWPENTPSANLEGMTPTALFNLIFDDDVMEYIVDQTNLYANQVKNKPLFQTCVSEMKKFFAILLMSGYCKLPPMHMYWENQPDVNNESISSAMSRSRFQEILQCIHFAGNSNLLMNDSYAKVGNFLTTINERCLLYFRAQQNLSIDESMIPYFGQNSCKQRMPVKPVRVGYKAWLMSTPLGYVVQFELKRGC